MLYACVYTAESDWQSPELGQIHIVTAKGGGHSNTSVVHMRDQGNAKKGVLFVFVFVFLD